MSTPFFKDTLAQQLKILNLAVEKEMNKGLKRLDISLTSTQVAVLMQMYLNTDQSLTQKQVETALKLSHPTTRGIIKRLTATGLLQTSPAVGDQRQIELRLTPAGTWFMKNHAGQIQAQATQTEDKLVSNLSTADQVTLQRLLTTLLTTMY
ncbi:MarR family winged helix-turn-helix transcriptional regulator [Levilactobacillus fujinensis]|uniref:MarR family winged helix-turn-helix transcriptional regulator n=1 Tax=Levilactobacillus fujinensis TaxID=2486024 RepID=A0ABW1THW3_9LACO|nr:MarR family transcriptional regulator [Levilactobacillus fujinensis]